MTYRFARFTLDAHASTLMTDGRIVPLPRKAVRTLAALVARAGHVVTKEQLLDELWPDGFVEESNLTQYVYLLRRLLRAYSLDRAIETVPRRGYRFTLPVFAVPVTPTPVAAPARRAPWRRLAFAAIAAITMTTVGGFERSGPRSSTDAETLRLYELGRYYWNLRTTASMLRSRGYFRAVIARAPASALGFAGLADAFTELADSCDSPPCGRWSREAERLARAAAVLDPNSSEAQTSLAMVTRLFERDDTTAAALFRRAIALDPSNFLAHQWYGNMLVAGGDLRGGRRQLEIAVALQPISTAIYAWLARDCYYERDYADAQRYAGEALALSPHRVETTILLGLIYQAQGRYRNAIGVFRRLRGFGDPGDADVLAAVAYAKAGDTARSRLILGKNAAHFASDPYVAKDLVIGYVALNADDTALKYLARVHFATPMDRRFFTMDPRLDGVRRDRRFASLM